MTLMPADRIPELRQAGRLQLIALAEDLGVSIGILAGQRGFLTNEWRSVQRLRRRLDVKELGKIAEQALPCWDGVSTLSRPVHARRPGTGKLTPRSARGPSLRRVVLSTSIIATTPSSDFRSTLHHFTGHAYRFRRYWSTRRRHPSDPDAGVETDLSCSRMGCMIVPLPIRRRVSGAARPRSSHRPWPSPR